MKSYVAKQLTDMGCDGSSVKFNLVLVFKLSLYVNLFLVFFQIYVSFIHVFAISGFFSKIFMHEGLQTATH